MSPVLVLTANFSFLLPDSYSPLTNSVSCSWWFSPRYFTLDTSLIFALGSVLARYSLKIFMALSYSLSCSEEVKSSR